jgi:hypothetical protein
LVGISGCSLKDGEWLLMTALLVCESAMLPPLNEHVKMNAAVVNFDMTLRPSP